jgi:hypothetical protein
MLGRAPPSIRRHDRRAARNRFNATGLRSRVRG